MVALDTHELAWAAGFFDGEGTISFKPNGKGNKGRPDIQIAQSEVYPLERFKLAVGVGKVYGPYGPYTTQSKPYWLYDAGLPANVQLVIERMWKYLSPTKRGQIERALILTKEANSRPYLKTGPKPKGVA